MLTSDYTRERIRKLMDYPVAVSYVIASCIIQCVEGTFIGRQWQEVRLFSAKLETTLSDSGYEGATFFDVAAAALVFGKPAVWAMNESVI